EVAELEVFEGLLDALARSEVFERPGPEAAADDRRPLEHGLRLGLEAIDARGDQGLERVGNSDRGLLFPALGDGEHDLLKEERIAPGLLEERPPRLRRDVADLA